MHPSAGNGVIENNLYHQPGTQQMLSPQYSPQNSPNMYYSMMSPHITSEADVKLESMHQHQLQSQHHHHHHHHSHHHQSLMHQASRSPSVEANSDDHFRELVTNGRATVVKLE